jgi:HSP90 family molecular chaperone
VNDHLIDRDPIHAEVAQLQLSMPGLLKLLGENLYSDPRVAYRELVQNAHDSCVRWALARPGEAYAPQIRVSSFDTVVPAIVVTPRRAAVQRRTRLLLGEGRIPGALSPLVEAYLGQPARGEAAQALHLNARSPLVAALGEMDAGEPRFVAAVRLVAEMATMLSGDRLSSTELVASVRATAGSIAALLGVAEGVV